jgi:hypothetical protein
MLSVGKDSAEAAWGTWDWDINIWLLGIPELHSAVSNLPNDLVYLYASGKPLAAMVGTSYV